MLSSSSKGFDQYQSLAAYLSQFPASAFTTPAANWSRDLATQVAAVAGRTGAVTVCGTAQESALYHALEEKIRTRAELDAEFARLLGRELDPAALLPSDFQKSRPGVQHPDARSYLATIPSAALSTHSSKWSSELAQAVAAASGRTASVRVAGSAQEVSRYHAFEEQLYSRIDSDERFRAMLDPVYVAVRFPDDGPAPPGWADTVETMPVDYRGATVDNNCRLFIMPGGGATGREEAGHFGGRLQERVSGLEFTVLVTPTHATTYS